MLQASTPRSSKRPSTRSDNTISRNSSVLAVAFTMVGKIHICDFVIKKYFVHLGLSKYQF